MNNSVTRTENFEDAIVAAVGERVDITHVIQLNDNHSLIETANHGSFVCESFRADNFVVDDIFTKVFQLTSKSVQHRPNIDQQPNFEVEFPEFEMFCNTCGNITKTGHTYWLCRVLNRI